MANSVDPDQTAPIGAVWSGSTLFASLLNLFVMLGNHLEQTTSADVIFRCILSWRFKGKYLPPSTLHTLTAIHTWMSTKLYRPPSGYQSSLDWLMSLMRKLLYFKKGEKIGRPIKFCLRETADSDRLKLQTPIVLHRGLDANLSREAIGS